MENLRLGSVDVAVSCLDSFYNSIFLGTFVLPCAETDGGDFCPSVEFESRWHFSEWLLLVY